MPSFKMDLQQSRASKEKLLPSPHHKHAAARTGAALLELIELIQWWWSRACN
ncbi:hypothetical protein SLEP1_g34330 [Rubroshorea leprosula]|uniref:Uncharacterized protein n=1 Tax=Rubroshorea leprosula TaxID=152421 RepID=A0AAV5KJH8_9ROSI|nr:hypothetical protein SLEP1_g34330 [Rubroshorea leprosula]